MGSVYGGWMSGKLVELEGCRLPVRTTGDIEPIQGGVLLPPGPVSILHPFSDGRFFQHGWHSWSYSGWTSDAESWFRMVPEKRRPMVDDPLCFSSRFQGGSGLGAIEGPTGKILLLGSLGLGARVENERDVLWGRSDGEGAQWFLTYGDEEAAFSRYANLLGKRLGVRGEGVAPRVWSSWYSFYRDIGEANLLRVLGDINGLPLDVFQVDDGWQRDIGDWQPNNRFPRGMDFLAKEIRENGLKPGIWLAPFIVRPTAEIFQKHTDWVLKDEHGEPVVAGENWGSPFYSLDVTHPQVLSWLRNLIESIQSWGYEYFKLDFLYAGALPGQHHTPMPREAAYRRAIDALRDGMRGGYFLACGAPVIASLGICDGIRIGPDVAPYWSDESFDLSAVGSKNAILTSANRLWLRPLVHTDPDVVFFRTKYNLLSPDQKHLLQDLAQIAGFKGTSDPPEWLDSEEMQELRKFFERAPVIKRIGNCRYLVGEREVDFRKMV